MKLADWLRKNYLSFVFIVLVIVVFTALYLVQTKP